jgi:hypothetical protein
MGKLEGPSEVSDLSRRDQLDVTAAGLASGNSSVLALTGQWLTAQGTVCGTAAASSPDGDFRREEP